MDLGGPGNNQPPLCAGGGRGGVGAALPPFSGSASRSRLHLLFLLQVGGRPAPAGHASGKRPPAPPRSGPEKHDPDLVPHKAGPSPAAGAAERTDRGCRGKPERTQPGGTESRLLRGCCSANETHTHRGWPGRPVRKELREGVGAKGQVCGGARRGGFCRWVKSLP